jgi:hypothetical protein
LKHRKHLRDAVAVQDPAVAPSALVLKDLDLIRSRDRLRTCRDVEELILLQSLEGRAHAGHGAFHGVRYINTTEDDLVRALNLDPPAIRRSRQALITEIGEWAERAMRGQTGEWLATEDGRPLLGIGTFAFLRVQPRDVLRGLYLGGLRDTLDARLAAEERYQIKVGAGRLYRVDVTVMRGMSLNGARLATEEHAGKIDEYRRVGLITEVPPSSDNSVRYLYIRHRAGPGASDDAAIVGAGLRFGDDVAVGVFLADAIDTLEKYVPTGQEGDQDAELARKIERDWAGLDVGFDEVCELILLAAGGPEVPDSSLRHLLRVDRLVDECPLESHFLFARDRPFAPLELGHERMPNESFYTLIEGRIERLRALPHPGSSTRH